MLSNLNLDKPYCCNIVNSNDENLKQLGLEPLLFNATPQYINLAGHIFYGEKNYPHYECVLANDIERILHIMNSNTYERFQTVYSSLNDDYPLRFSIYNHQLFFHDSKSLYMYKNNQEIRREINKKYNLSETFYEPTTKEINEGYSEDYIIKHKDIYGTKEEFFTFNLTPQEQFQILLSLKREELKPYTNLEQLSGNAVRHWLNCNANLFIENKCSRKTTGIYNDNAMKLINNLLETKLEIYEFFNTFLQQVGDWKDTLKELLIKLNVYKEFTPSKIENNDFFLPDIYVENNYWNQMFQAASFDLLVQFIGFDKIETQKKKTITTSKKNIYEEFFNLLLLDYDVVELPKLIFDADVQHFRWISPSFINAGVNREYENEIRLIKKYVPYEERQKYFIKE